MDTLRYLVERYNLNILKESPIEIPNEGRDILGHWFKDLGFKLGVELGVERGIFSRMMLDANPEMELHCVDSWQPYAGYIARIANEELITKFDETKERLKGYNVVYHKKFSMDALKDFEDNSLDFVYIDANHDLPWCMNDIIQWNKKVRPGGILAGHDYINARMTKPSRCFVKDAVHWYTELKPIKPWFLIGLQEKIPGFKRDNARTFFWVKE